MSIAAIAVSATTAVVGFAAGATQETSITIDPTFWVAFFGFLTSVVAAVVTYKTKLKAEEIGTKVDGTATATQAEIASLRAELARVQEDRLARADAAPQSVLGAVVPAPATATVADPLPVVVVDAEKPIEVHVVKPGTPYRGEK